MTRRAVSGVLPVDKGPGVTSFQVVAQLKRALSVSKIGHGGTLDPDATGVRPILIGEATKLTPYLIDLDKEYLATVCLGLVTDTQDLGGTVQATHPVPNLDRATIERALDGFRGTIRQVPPMYSALHHGGRRLYELAREGQTVEREAREVTVHAIQLESIALPDLTLRVRCGKGTYIRTLAADLGQALGTGAALAALVRTRVGPYALEDAVRWPDVKDGRDPERLVARLLPLSSALGALPIVDLDAPRARAFCHGQAAAVPAAPSGRVRVHGADGALLGVGVARGGFVRPERLLHADHPRPSILPA